MKKIFVCLFCSFLCLNANAAVDKNLVSMAEKYLNSVTGLSGNFVQTANGKSNKGWVPYWMYKKNKKDED